MDIKLSRKEIEIICDVFEFWDTESMWTGLPEEEEYNKRFSILYERFKELNND